jgi:hypothetical protein
MKLVKSIVGAALLTAVVGTANAIPTTWTDTIDFVPNVPIGDGGSYSYQHDLTRDNFTPIFDAIDDFQLTVNLFDDGGRGDSLEWVLIDVPGLLGDVIEFNVSGTEFGGWSLAGYLQLALTGLYDVTITSLTGDFYLGDSTLTAWGDDRTTNVPEPATLGLIGLGLLGFAASRKKKI